MDQLVLLVIIGLISLINWVMQKAAEKREQAKFEREESERGVRNIHTPPPQKPTALRRAPFPKEDPLKDLMQALGLPPEAGAPQLVRPRAAAEVEEFASLEDGHPLRPKTAAVAEKPRWQPPSVRRPDEKTARLAYAFTHQGELPAKESKASGARGLLTDRASKRRAVILAEILGPPRALQPSAVWGAAR